MVVLYLEDDGCIQLPSELLKQMQIQSGDSIEFLTSAEDAIILRPVRD